ncbi:hypothetical protein PILCRDRAFT_115963 [Piloderma croceum F 1598]|uniref:DUF6533 domain-containing protein n=1 Tax=Piloderma croceum (strain F 1598) TaxID=765440 RepID=A0A0C3C079_PILCF|nr:hypothetical protein PILCRDRAFT_115963 [Piloderma croceum F 1598]
MSTSPAVRYVPLNTDSPAVFRGARVSNYLTAAFVTLLLYDHVISLDKEVEWIWTLRWRLPKMIFIINRYLITLLLLLACFTDFMYPLPVSVHLSYLPVFNMVIAR